MNRKMTSLIALICCIGIMLSACSTGNPAQPPAPAEPTASAGSNTGAAEPIRLTAGIVQAVDHPFTIAMNKFADYVSEGTDGAVTIEVFPANQLGEERDITAGLTEGTIDFCLNANGELAKRVEGYSIGDAPYVFKSPEHLQKVVMSDVFQVLHKELLDKHGIRVLGSFYLGTRNITSSSKKIQVPEDLKGFKIRVPDQKPAMDAFKLLGANPTPVPFSELYLALQQGVVAGQENPFSQILGNKLYEVQKYLSLTGHITQCLYLTISEKTYQKLTPDQRQVIEDAATRISDEATEEMIGLEKNEQLKQLVDYGMEVVEVDQNRFRELVNAELPGSGYFDVEMYKKIQSIE